MKIIWFLLLSSLLSLSMSVGSKTQDIPIEDFFKTPKFSNLQLSPNGKYLAVLSPINERRNIVVMEVDGFKNARPITKFDEQDISYILVPEQYAEKAKNDYPNISVKTA